MAEIRIFQGGLGHMVVSRRYSGRPAEKQAVLYQGNPVMDQAGKERVRHVVPDSCFVGAESVVRTGLRVADRPVKVVFPLALVFDPERCR